MRDHQQIPSVSEDPANVANDVLIASVLGWQEIARPSVMTEGGERAPHCAGEFAGH